MEQTASNSRYSTPEGHNLDIKLDSSVLPKEVEDFISFTTLLIFSINIDFSDTVFSKNAVSEYSNAWEQAI